MQFTESEAVGDDRLAEGMTIGQDVCRIEEFVVTQPTDGAALAVGTQDPKTKVLLMEASTDHGRDVRAACGDDRWIVCFP